MDFIKKVIHSAKTKLHRPQKLISNREQELLLCLKPYERYLYKIQHIVKWEEPTESVLSIILVNILFWFLTYFQWRFYGLLFALLCSFVVREAWTEHIWPEIRLPNEKINEKEIKYIKPPEGSLTLLEISQYAASVRNAVYKQCNRLRYLRATQPPVYCAIVSMGCLVIAGIGTILSGLALLYVTIMTFMIVPGIVKHFLSPEHKDKLYNAINSITSVLIPPEDNENIEEYMPESTKENLVLLSQAGDNNDLSTPSTDDSSLGDLMMPGYDESSVETIESLMLPTIPQDSSEDTDSEIGALRFRSSHFNGDGSSTDEEVSLVKDLIFPDVSNIAENINNTTNSSNITSNTSAASSITQTVAGVLYKTFTGAVGRGAGGLKFQTTSTDTTDSQTEPLIARDAFDSDSEFEIIDSEDADA